jgi:hypothetical protein
MTQKVVDATNPLAQDLDTFINVYMRQHTVWFTAAHQELYQIDEQLRNTLLSLGTYILGGTSSMQSARDLADALFFRDPFRLKDAEPIYGRRFLHSPLEVIDVKLHFMPLEEQTELFAQRIRKLGRFQFLFRPALAEGHIGQDVLSLSIQDLDRDKATGEYQFPEAPLMARLRTALATQSGIPMQRLLQEQENRLPQAVPESRQTRPESIRRLTPPQPRLRQPQPHRHREQQPPRHNESAAPQTPPAPQPVRKVVRQYRIPQPSIPAD